MKKITLLVCLIINFTIFAQTTYTFIGGTDQGNWTNTANWSGGNAPGNTVGTQDTVEILGNVLVSIFSGTTIINNGTILVSNGANGAPTFTIFTSASLTNNGTFNITNGSLTATGTIQNNGMINAQSTDFTIDTGGSLTNTDSFDTTGINTRVFLNNGTITNNNGASFDFGTNVTNNNNFNNNGMVTVSNGTFSNLNSFNNTTTTSTLQINGPGDLINETNGTLDNSGNITIDNFAQLSNKGSFINLTSGFVSTTNTSTLRLFPNSSINNQGEISNDSSSRIDIEVSFTNEGTIINNNILDFESLTKLTNNGLLINNSDIISFANPSPFTLIENSSTGMLEGINNTHSDNFMNSGIFSPGNVTDATGTYTFDQNLVFEPLSELNIEIESLTDFDNVIADNVSFNEPNPSDPFNPTTGILNVSLLNNYEPNVGDSFVIMTGVSSFSNSIIGQFDTTNFPTFNGKTFEIVYNAKDITLNVVTTLSTDGFSIKTFKMHPNPSQTFMYVDGLVNEEKATIYNPNGQLIKSFEISPIDNKIDTSALPKGIFFLNIKGNSQKFLKQ